MAVQNYVVALNEFAQKSRLILRYEDIGTDGPDHRRTFTIRVEMGAQFYPEGVGPNKKEAKQNAAKNALDAIDGGSIQQNHSVCRPECVSPCPVQGPITQPNYVCWLNEYSQKKKVTIKPIESTIMGQTNTTQCCKYVVGNIEFPEAFGSTKKEAKEEAAKAVYKELCREPNKEAVEEEQKEGAIEQKYLLSQSVSTPCSSATETPSMKPETNCMGLLNHHCQKNKMVLDYKLIKKRGPAHSPLFVYKVVIDKREYPEAEGKTAKEAKQAAAQLACAILQQSDWSSQVSSRPTISENSTSSPSSIRDSGDKAETENQAESTSESIIFKDSYSFNNPKMAYNLGDVKPKRTLAPSFSMGNRNVQGRGAPPLKNNNLPEKTNQTTDSLFLKDYDEIQPIGKGGFGRVFKARKKIENKYVAVKIVKDTRKALREIDALSDLQHPNIVRYYHAWIEDTRYQCEVYDSYSSSHSSGSSMSGKYLYIQMELCEKGTLKAWIDERHYEPDPKRSSDALCILQQVVAGVKYIHSKKLIHRDLKPLNILFGSESKVKIGDFGLVTSAETDSDEGLLERTKRTGTLLYMSPEQMNQLKYDKEVDIFALGLIYFELLWKMTTGSEKAKIWKDVRRNVFPQQFYVKHSLEHKLIERMLSEEPKNRPDASKIDAELAKYSINLEKDQHTLQEMKTI